MPAVAGMVSGCWLAPTDPGNSEPPLVVQGILSPGTSTQTVLVRIADLVDDNSVGAGTPVVGAVVRITSAIDTASLTEVAPGRYEGALTVSHGTTYELQLSTPAGLTAFGRTTIPSLPRLQAIDTLLLDRNAVISLRWQASANAGGYAIYVSDRVAPEEETLRFFNYATGTNAPLQPLRACANGCCDRARVLILALTGPVFRQRGFPVVVPTSTDTLIGAAGVFGAASADSIAFRYSGNAQCEQ